MIFQRWWSRVFPRQKPRPTPPPPAPPDPRLEAARRHAEDLSVRSDRVAAVIVPRLRRNHWGETVASIARREH